MEIITEEKVVVLTNVAEEVAAPAVRMAAEAVLGSLTMVTLINNNNRLLGEDSMLAPYPTLLNADSFHYLLHQHNGSLH